MQAKRERLIAGLGNPGQSYDHTRHNIGFLVVNELAEAFSIEIHKNRSGAETGRGTIEEQRVILAKPQTYMNNSGGPVQKIAGYFKILCEDILVIHDDIDLAYGRIKIKEKGGHGGHKGVASIINAFGNGNFTRIRVGVGRSGSEKSVSDHVLSRFSSDERKDLPDILKRAKDAVVMILTKGNVEAMNRFNRKPNE